MNAEPRGHLAVTAPVLFGRLFILPLVMDYLQRHPSMHVSAFFLDRVANLLEEGLDVAVRIGELPDSGMKAVRVAYVGRLLCASPEYLRKHGEPEAPSDLAEHCIISALGVSPTVEWKFGDGRDAQSVRVKPRLAVTSNEAAIDAAVQGFGITRLMSYQVAPHLASGALKVVLSKYQRKQIPVHVLHREARYTSAKVRTFVDWLVAALRGNPALNDQ